jgi:hypothetical protein
MNVFKIKSIIIHPEYNSNTFKNDIAILETTENIVFNSSVQPSYIQSYEIPVSSDVLITGIKK